MKYSKVQNPRWANPEHTAIDCEVMFDAVPGAWSPFTAVETGDYPHSHQIFAECVSGKYGPVGEYSQAVAGG